MMIAFSQNKISDEEVIARAEALGMVMKEDEPLFPPEKETETEIIVETEITTETEQESETEVVIETESEVSTETEISENSEQVETQTTESEVSNEEVYHLVIPSGSYPRLICNELEDNGVIENAASLRQYLADMGFAKSIVAGSYDIPYGATNEEVYQIFKEGPKK